MQFEIISTKLITDSEEYIEQNLKTSNGSTVFLIDDGYVEKDYTAPCVDSRHIIPIATTMIERQFANNPKINGSVKVTFALSTDLVIEIGLRVKSASVAN